MNVYVVGNSFQYIKMFKERGFNVVDDLCYADLVQFTGGEDVSPFLYGQHTHRTTYNNPSRDSREKHIFEMCATRNIKMAGICRGGQFLNVMNGGEMFQDVDNHAIMGTHGVLDLETNAIIECTSTHHQMMRPGVTTSSVVGVASEPLASYKESMTTLTDPYDVIESEDVTDYEVLYYKDTNSLCFQPHPEIVRKEHPCQEYYFQLLERYLNVKV